MKSSWCSFNLRFFKVLVLFVAVALINQAGISQVLNDPDPGRETGWTYHPHLEDAIFTETEKAGIQPIYRVDVRMAPGELGRTTSWADETTRHLAANQAFRVTYPLARTPGLLAVTYADDGKEGGTVVNPGFSECCFLQPATLVRGDGQVKPMPRLRTNTQYRGSDLWACNAADRTTLRVGRWVEDVEYEEGIIIVTARWETTGEIELLSCS